MTSHLTNEITAASPLAMSFLHRENTVCWVHRDSAAAGNVSSTTIALTCSRLDQGTHKTDGDREKAEKTEVLPNQLLKHVTKMAVDWASGNWYFLDDTRDLIVMCGAASRSSKSKVVGRCKVILSVQ